LTRNVLLLSLFSLFLLMTVALPAAAAELKVFCTHALTPAMEQLVANFERTTGNKVVIIDSTTGAAVKRIQGGESADVAILGDPAIRSLAKEGKLDPKSVKAIGSTGVAIGVKAGAPKPDISTPAALKQTLLAAKSVAYSDPAAGGGSGIHFAKVVQRLGIADQLKPKTTLVGGGGAVGPLAAEGKVQLAVQMESELRAVKGVDVVGQLPGDFQEVTLFSAGIFTGSKNAAGGKKLIQMLKSAKSAPILKASGVQVAK